MIGPYPICGVVLSRLVAVLINVIPFNRKRKMRDKAEADAADNPCFYFCFSDAKPLLLARKAAPAALRQTPPINRHKTLNSAQIPVKSPIFRYFHYNSLNKQPLCPSCPFQTIIIFRQMSKNDIPLLAFVCLLQLLRKLNIANP